MDAFTPGGPCLPSQARAGALSPRPRRVGRKPGRGETVRGESRGAGPLAAGVADDARAKSGPGAQRRVGADRQEKGLAAPRFFFVLKEVLRKQDRVRFKNLNLPSPMDG